MKDIMLRIDNVSKQYRLGQIGGTTLYEELQRLGARLRHKEDPTRKIGAKEYVPGETFMALDGVSFEVRCGERVGIIGHNGAGKSTLLKLISRVTAPTSGTIGLNGRVASMLEVGTGFHPELTGRENVYMNGAILGMTRREIDSKMEDIIEFSECRQFIDTPVKRYSSGMYVKLAFSVAAHLESEIMIMDEVLAVGDMAFQKKCLEKMGDVSKGEGRTILYVSHNMNTIRQLCDRVVVLDHGSVMFDGDVEQGIQCYLSSKDLGIAREFNVANVERHGSPTGKLRIIRSRILNDIPLAMRSLLTFQLLWDASEDIDDELIFRILIGCQGRLIGMATTSCLNVRKSNLVTIELDTSMLAPGRYFANIEGVSIKSGSQVFHESVRAFQFEVSEDREVTGGFSWYRPWGFISFPEARCLSESYGQVPNLDTDMLVTSSEVAGNGNRI